jgi:hypothetical protein
MVPQLCIIGEVEGRICDALVLQSAQHAEVAFSLVQSWQWIVDAIILQELHLVRDGEPVIILFIIVTAAIWRSPIILVAQGALGVKEANVHELLLLALLCECRLDGNHLIVQGNQ